MSGLRLIVGLGNPGPKYERTRHNVGFAVIDEFLRSLPFKRENGKEEKGEISSFGNEKQARGGTFRELQLTAKNPHASGLNQERCYVLKPEIFMNRSGEVVREFCEYYKIATTEVLVVHDELDLELGVLRLKVGGGHGGHNGLRSIIDETGSGDFLRLRIGIGRPPIEYGHDAVSNWVLSAFPPDQQVKFEGIKNAAAKAICGCFFEKIESVQRWLHKPGP